MQSQNKEHSRTIDDLERKLRSKEKENQALMNTHAEHLARVDQ